MNHTTDGSEEGTLSISQSELSLTDEGSSGETVGTGSKPKKGPWTSTEDALLMEYVKKHGEGNWNAVQKNSGLLRCGKSCRLRWANHLRPNLKKGAFSAEEERIIIELHAQIGNKWARMAAHLPGRTDNEIKHYWNTRLKRRQRAGQPLYPPEVCLALQDNQCHYSSGFNSGEKRHHDNIMDDIPDCVLSVLKTNHDLMSYVPEIPHIPSSSLLVRGPSSSQYCSFVPPTMHCQKRFRESMPRFSDYDLDVSEDVAQFEQLQDDQCTKFQQSFGLSFPYDPDDIMMYHLPLGITQDSHSLNNGNFSASKPTPGAVKSELPSLQYAETDLGIWDPCSMQPALPQSVDLSPLPTGTVKFECTSPHNSGMLENIVYESMALINVQNHSSDTISDSFIVPPCDIANNVSTQNLRENDRELYDESIPPYFRSASAPSLFNECTPISGGGISVHEKTPAGIFPALMVKSEPADKVLNLDEEKDEVLQGSDWPEQNNVCNDEERTMMSDTLTTIIGSDYDYNHMYPELFQWSQGEEWSFGSCAWNNMPAARTSLPS